jgi:methylmalonyl-CoA mutase
MARLLVDIRIDAIDLSLDAGPHGGKVAEAFAQWLATQPVDPERLSVSFGLDPIGSAAADGKIDPDFAGGLGRSVQSLRRQHFKGPFAAASGVVWHDRGSSEAQELAFAIATGVAYLRALDHLEDDDLKRAVTLTLAADQDMFMTLAKFRAGRLLWSRILSASGLPKDAIILKGDTSWRMMTALDAHTNILRTTAAVFGAALGGADQITVLPFSLAQGLPDEFARRIARNTQTILQEEAQLWRVSDPASGSGYAEHLTDQLCEKAWSLFQDIERQGGIAASIASGNVAALIAEKCQQKLARIQEKAETIIGVTAYKAAREMPPAIEVAPRRPASAHRLAEAFETAGRRP